MQSPSAVILEPPKMKSVTVSIGGDGIPVELFQILKDNTVKMLHSICQQIWKTQHSENEDHGIQSHHFMANRWGINGNSERLYFWAPKSLQMVIAAMKLKDACSLQENYDQTRQHMKKQRCTFANKGPSSQSYGFSSSHVWM